MVHLDGHELAILGTISGAWGVCNATLGKGWFRKFVNTQPVPAMSVCLGLAGIAMPLFVVPIRRSIGLPTNQYDATHPKVKFPKFAEV